MGKLNSVDPAPGDYPLTGYMPHQQYSNGRTQTTSHKPQPRPQGVRPQNHGKQRGFSWPRRTPNRVERSEVGICTKHLLFFENAIFFLVGLALMVIGAYILSHESKSLDDPLDILLDPAVQMCLAGCLVFLLASCGCTGALRENTCLLKMFYYMMTLFLLLEVLSAVLFFLMYYVKDVRNFLFPEDTFHQAILHYRRNQDMRNLIDSIQSSLGCCGLSDSDTGYEDWNSNMYFNCTPENTSPERCSVPPSCCKMEAGAIINLECGANIYTIENGKRVTSDTSRIYTEGCLKALGDWINEHSLIVGGGLLAVLLPQVFVIFMTRSLLDMIRAQKRKWKQ